MPSFDIVSKLDIHELTNALEQAQREIKNRFDFKGSKASFTLNENIITLHAPTKFQIEQMHQILITKLGKRGINLNCLVYGRIQENLHDAHQEITLRYGIDQEISKKITKLIKATKLKVQTTTMGTQLRVNAKKKDDLQAIITLLKQEEFPVPLQFDNLRA